VVVDAHADNNAQNVIASRLPRGIRFMIRRLSLSLASYAPGLLREESRSLEALVPTPVRRRSNYFRDVDKCATAGSPGPAEIVDSSKSGASRANASRHNRAA
jgi:hypothetical protein